VALIQKPLGDITEVDVSARVKERTAEHQTLEYKATAYGPTASEKRELLKDVSSMANTGGGDLIIGVEEDPENKGVPLQVTGIEDGDKEALRVLQICTDGIEERIDGLDVKSIRLGSGRDIVIIRVPGSARSPHMVTHEGHRQFWARYGTITAPMRVVELREAFRRDADVRWQLEELLQEKKHFLINPVLPAARRNDEWLVERLDMGHAFLQKLSTGQTVIVALTWIRETRRDSLDRHVILELGNARMQWTHPSQRWQCLEPRPDPTTPLGFGRAVGGPDIKYVPSLGGLSAMGYEFRWSFAQKAAMLEAERYEVLYDDEGLFSYISDARGPLVLFGRTGAGAREPR